MIEVANVRCAAHVVHRGDIVQTLRVSTNYYIEVSDECIDGFASCMGG